MSTDEIAGQILEARGVIASGLLEDPDAPTQDRRLLRLAQDFRPSSEYERLASLKDAGDPVWDQQPQSVHIAVGTYLEQRDAALAIRERGLQGYKDSQAIAAFELDEDLEFLCRLKEDDLDRWSQMSESARQRADWYARDKRAAQKAGRL